MTGVLSRLGALSGDADYGFAGGYAFEPGLDHFGSYGGGGNLDLVADLAVDEDGYADFVAFHRIKPSSH